MSSGLSLWATPPQEYHDESGGVPLPFLPVEMISTIVAHTNSHANEHIFSGTHQSHARPDGSWQNATADEIEQLIAILIYFVLVKIVGNVDKYWSKKTLYHGLWAQSILSRKRFKALMALLHVVGLINYVKSSHLSHMLNLDALLYISQSRI